MARAKNRGYQQTFTPTYTIRRWKMGGYIRLSREDLQKINRGLDSYRNPDSVNSIIVPITNVMNDQYCYQTLKKIRQVFDYKRRNGQYIGSFVPYGYESRL